MLKVESYTNMNIILVLIVILIILLLIRGFLIKKLNKKTLEIARKINIGNEEIQEDYAEIEILSKGTIAVLGDGLGENEAGRISSTIAVKTIIKMFKEEGSIEKLNYFFKKAFNKANHELIKRVEQDKGGASVLSVIVNDNLLYYALVGDVMLAIFRNNELIKLSEGHAISEVAKKEYYNGNLKRNEALYALKEEKVLYYVGQETFKNIEISEIPIELYKKDIIVLMSKGIYEGMSWIEFEGILGDKKYRVKDMCQEIVERVNDNKNSTNGSIILMKYM